MRNSKLKAMLCGFLLCALAVVCMAQRTNMNNGNTFWQNNIVVNSTLTAPTVTATTVNATNVNVATAFTNNGIEIMPPTAVSLTSPTVTTTAAGARLLVITTDETQTGFIINGGTLNQVLTIRGTNDSSTVRFDDGTSYTLAGNAELGLNDYIVLQCTAAGNPASTWAEISRSLN